MQLKFIYLARASLWHKEYSFFFLFSTSAPAHDEEGRRTKTFLRSLMNPQCLFLLYNIHKSLLTDSLDFEARDFASTNTHRINYFTI